MEAPLRTKRRVRKCLFPLSSPSSSSAHPSFAQRRIIVNGRSIIMPPPPRPFRSPKPQPTQKQPQKRYCPARHWNFDNPQVSSETFTLLLLWRWRIIHIFRSQFPSNNYVGKRMRPCNNGTEREGGEQKPDLVRVFRRGSFFNSILAPERRFFCDALFRHLSWRKKSKKIGTSNTKKPPDPSSTKVPSSFLESPRQGNFFYRAHFPRGVGEAKGRLQKLIMSSFCRTEPKEEEEEQGKGDD